MILKFTDNQIQIFEWDRQIWLPQVSNDTYYRRKYNFISLKRLWVTTRPDWIPVARRSRYDFGTSLVYRNTHADTYYYANGHRDVRIFVLFCLLRLRHRRWWLFSPPKRGQTARPRERRSSTLTGIWREHMAVGSRNYYTRYYTTIVRLRRRRRNTFTGVGEISFFFFRQHFFFSPQLFSRYTFTCSSARRPAKTTLRGVNTEQRVIVRRRLRRRCVIHEIRISSFVFVVLSVF